MINKILDFIIRWQLCVGFVIFVFSFRGKVVTQQDFNAMELIMLVMTFIYLGIVALYIKLKKK